jgi:hypothetical protein
MKKVWIEFITFKYFQTIWMKVCEEDRKSPFKMLASLLNKKETKR